MQNPLSPFAQGLLPGVQQPKFTRPVKQSEAIASAQQAPKHFNPFLAGQNNDTPEFRAMYGVNRPLKDAMFLGYKDDKPMYGGTRLFLLY